MSPHLCTEGIDNKSSMTFFYVNKLYVCLSVCHLCAHRLNWARRKCSKVYMRSQACFRPIEIPYIYGLKHVLDQ